MAVWQRVIQAPTCYFISDGCSSTLPDSILSPIQQDEEARVASEIQQVVFSDEETLQSDARSVRYGMVLVIN